MKKIRTADLRPGMKFNKSVFIDPNNILVGPGVSVKQKDIERLLAWGIEELETAGEVTDTGEQDFDSSLSPIGDIARKKAELNRVVAMQGDKRGSIQSKLDVLEDEPALKSEDFKVQLGMDTSKTDLQEEYGKWLKIVERAFLDAGSNTRLDKKSLNKVVDAIIAHLKDRQQDMVQHFQSFHSDKYLYSHSLNVAILGGVVGLNMAFEKTRLHNLLLGCLLIDVGMVKIPAYIHEKKGRLTPEEVKVIRTHPLHAYRILVQENGFPHDSGLVALEHHEQCDGGGYPRSLPEEKISLFGKIGAVIDTYAAMTQKRSYREEMISYDAMRSVLSAGQRRYDQNILNAFLKQIGVYPIGSYVQLNNNSIGQVISADPALPMRPNLRVIRDEFGDPVMEEEEITLAVEKDLYIVKPLTKGEVDVLRQHQQHKGEGQGS